MRPLPGLSSPLEVMSLSWRMAVMLTEAQAVMALRMAGFWGLWQLGPGEATRMVAEKMAAAGQSGAAAARAAAKGGSPAAVAGAALAPVSRRTRANAARLARLGPALPPRRD